MDDDGVGVVAVVDRCPRRVVVVGREALAQATGALDPSWISTFVVEARRDAAPAGVAQQGATFDGAGKLALPGGTLSSANAETIAGYVDLPNGIISSLVNATFEAWVTWDGSGSWQRIFDFGASGGGEDISNGNGAYLFMSPQGDANLRFAARDPRTGAEPTQLTSAAPVATGTEVTWTFQKPMQLVRFLFPEGLQGAPVGGGGPGRARQRREAGEGGRPW